MVDITKGFTFDDTVGAATGHTATSALLQAMISSAAPTNFGSSEFLNSSNQNKAQTFHSVAVTTPVGPSTQQSGGTTFYEEVNDIIRVQQHGAYDAQFDFITVVNATATVIPKGTCLTQSGLLASTVPLVNPTITLGYPNILGIAPYTIAGSSPGLAQKYGPVEVLLDGAFTAGDLLVTGTRTGHAVSVRDVPGYTLVTFGIAFAQCLKEVPAGGQTLVTCQAFL